MKTVKTFSTSESAALDEEQSLSTRENGDSGHGGPGANGVDAKPSTAVQENGLGLPYRTVSVHLSAKAPLFPFDQKNSRAGEQYRIVRTKILQHLLQPKILVVSSATPGDGKTINSLNLAGVLALKPDLKVLFLEADFHRGGVSSMLGLPKSPGLSELLKGTCTLEDALIQVEQMPNLFVMVAGESGAASAELLDSPQWRALNQSFRKQFSMIVIDSPPVGILADFDLLQAVADGVIFIVRPDHTNRSLCLKAFDIVPEQKLMGIIVNAAEDWFLSRSEQSYYGYGYYYARKED
jgi:capsular exopolysaccharide synthesis family protein